MARFADQSVLDALLNEIANGTRLTVCAGQPTDFADIASRILASETLTGGDFTLAAGDVSGRKVTVAAQADLSISASGTADHVAIDDGTTLLYVTTCPSQALTLGGTVSTQAFDAEVADPAAP